MQVADVPIHPERRHVQRQLSRRVRTIDHERDATISADRRHFSDWHHYRSRRGHVVETGESCFWSDRRCELGKEGLSVLKWHGDGYSDHLCAAPSSPIARGVSNRTIDLREAEQLIPRSEIEGSDYGIEPRRRVLNERQSSPRPPRKCATRSAASRSRGFSLQRKKVVGSASISSRAASAALSTTEGVAP